ncbi:MAG: sulfite exporter TauE/SafE family protein [Clostridia bacterium]|nr:sulfite exporter TauE/SafE family protein [Clostridia bacterium]
MQKGWEKSGKVLGGGLTGLINGLFGGGGGMIVVPLLERELDVKEAHATAILVILPISIAALAVYLWKQRLAPSVFVPVALGSTLGAYLGTRLLCALASDLVGYAFSALMFLAGAWMLL